MSFNPSIQWVDTERTGEYDAIAHKAKFQPLDPVSGYWKLYALPALGWVHWFQPLDPVSGYWKTSNRSVWGVFAVSFNPSIQWVDTESRIMLWLLSWRRRFNPSIQWVDTESEIGVPEIGVPEMFQPLDPVSGYWKLWEGRL